MAGGANSLMGRAFLQQSGMLGDKGVPSYIPPSQLSTQKSGSSNISPMPTMSNDLIRPAVSQTTQAPAVSPIVQQMAQRIQAQQSNPFASGLQSLYSQFNVPQQTMAPRAPMQMPVYQNPALNYRPNMQQVQQNLSRVKPSVYKTDLDAARQRIAELEAAEQARQAQQDQYNYYNYG